MGITISPKVFIAIALLTVVLFASHIVPSAEDATILFRYADNLALTHRITYNAGDLPVEGATDFLWMVLLAVGRLFYAPPQITVGILNVLAIVGIAAILSKSFERRLTWDTLLFSLAALALCPQIVAALSGFSVLAFGFLLLLMLFCFVQDLSRGMALSCLALCLMRPDGVVFALPLYAVSIRHKSRSTRWWLDAALYFVLPGALYFFWRVLYFHELWPLPFIVKSDAVRWKYGFVKESVEDISRYLLPALFLVALVSGRRLLRLIDREIVFCTMVVPSLFYSCIRLDQNYADRFFFYLLVVPAFIFSINRDRVQARLKLFSVITAGVWVLAFAWPYYFAMFHLICDRYQVDGLVARDIRNEGLHGTMAITEAGRLAYDSQWRAIDLWGLNYPTFAKRLVQPKDIETLHPDLVVIRSTTCSVSPRGISYTAQRTWDNMARNALEGVLASNLYSEIDLPYNESRFATKMELFEDGNTTFLCYFINRNYPQRHALIGLLQTYKQPILSAKAIP